MDIAIISNIDNDQNNQPINSEIKESKEQANEEETKSIVPLLPSSYEGHRYGIYVANLNWVFLFFTIYILFQVGY